jgi:hypothetical protein
MTATTYNPLSPYWAQSRVRRSLAHYITQRAPERGHTWQRTACNRVVQAWDWYVVYDARYDESFKGGGIERFLDSGRRDEVCKTCLHMAPRRGVTK